MDFGNDDLNCFSVFYDRLKQSMMARGAAYQKALKKTYSNSVDYCDAIKRAYEKDGFVLPVDLTEPEDRVRCEFWNFFCRQTYSVETKSLLELVPVVVRRFDIDAVSGQRFWYGEYCENSAMEIHDALIKSGANADGTRRIGEILKEPPFPLREPPEFCPTVDQKPANKGIGPRPDAKSESLQKLGLV